MYVEDVGDRSNTPKGCNAMCVRDVEDRSNTPKGCNAMYVGRCQKIDQIHLRAVMLCMSEMSKIDQNTPKGCNAMYVGDVKDRSKYT